MIRWYVAGLQTEKNREAPVLFRYITFSTNCCLDELSDKSDRKAIGLIR